MRYQHDTWVNSLDLVVEIVGFNSDSSMGSTSGGGYNGGNSLDRARKIVTWLHWSGVLRRPSWLILGRLLHALGGQAH